MLPTLNVVNVTKAVASSVKSVAGRVKQLAMSAGGGDTFGSMRNIAIAVIVVIVTIMLGLFIATILGSSLSNVLPNAQPGSLAYNVTHPFISAFENLGNTSSLVFVLITILIIVAIASLMIKYLVENFRT